MKIEKESSEHYVWGEHCESWVLQNSENLIVKQEMMPTNTKEQLHFHEKAEQFFYVLKGSAIFFIEGESFEISEKQGISVKANQKHFISNESSGDLEFLVISTSATDNDRVLI